MPSNGPELNVLNVVLAAVPIAILIVTMLVSALKWSAPKAGAVSWLAAAGLALLVFGADERVLAIGSSKGLSLSLFVLTIIWTSVMLYNVIEGINGITVIGRTITGLVRDPLAQALVVGWAFAGLIQGVAGFGLPIAVVAPFMVMIGFRPSTAVAITLVGHAWAVTFGSLGSSYYTIQLVSGLDERELGVQMAAMFVLPDHLDRVRGGAPAGRFRINSTRSACHRLDGRGHVPRTVDHGISRRISDRIGRRGPHRVRRRLVDFSSANPWLRSQDDDAPPSTQQPAEKPAGIGFHTAFLPYYLLFGLSLISQLPPVRELGSTLYFGLDYPSTATALGFTVDGQEGYAKIKLLNHPAPLIAASLLIAYVVYRVRGLWRPDILRSAARKTYEQVISNSVGVATMVMMALVMTDTGMTALLGSAIAKGTGTLFPIFSPYIGVLGSFMTGSNTNSNAMFGSLQVETAAALGIGLVTIAATQSIGGSLGSSVAMSKVMAGTAVVGLGGRERDVLMKTIPYCLVLVLVVGLQAWVIINLLGGK